MKSPPLLSLALSGAALLAASTASAQRSGDDGMYHRVAGDLGLQVDVGSAVAGGKSAVVARATMRYLQTAGLYATYLDDFRSDIGPGSRSASFGVELRPLFLPRTGLDLEHGPATLDLFIDSFALRFGAVVGRQPGFDLSAPGLESAIAFGLPLTRSAAGPWIDASVGMRLSDRNLWRQQHIDLDRAAVLTLTLGWQSIVDAHLVDASDGLRR